MGLAADGPHPAVFSFSLGPAKPAAMHLAVLRWLILFHPSLPAVPFSLIQNARVLLNRYGYPPSTHFLMTMMTALMVYALHLAVCRTTLEPDVTGATVAAAAATELAAHAAAGATALDAAHAAAWADAYGLLSAAGGAVGGGGSIELAGDAGLAAKIKSSLYYLLCSVRSDWPQGISEGGIGSEAYRGMMFWSDGVMDGPLFAGNRTTSTPGGWCTGLSSRSNSTACLSWSPTCSCSCSCSWSCAFALAQRIGPGAAINAPVADALLEYRTNRLAAAESIARLNGYQGAYWPWQSAVTGYERSCGNVSIVMKTKTSDPKRVGCYWMHEIHISADVALYFRMNYHRSGGDQALLKEVVYPVVAATADFFLSRANRSAHASKNWTFLQVCV